MKFLLATLFFIVTFSASAQKASRFDSLKTVLEAVFRTDQEPRMALDSIQKKYTFDSPEMKAFWASVNKQDSINQKTVTAIIDKYGWLSETETSEESNSALFLVIQHADLNTQLKYLPIMKEAVKQGKAKPSAYALLVDRTNMYQGKFQIYGSQIINDTKGNHLFFPIVDEPHVNARRKSMGLDSLEAYAKFFHIRYKLPKTDALKNKIVITGHIFDKDNKTLNEVSLYWGNNQKIAQTDSTGAFQLVVDKSYIGWALVFRKKGFESGTFVLDDAGKEVFQIYYVLNKKQN